MLRQVSIQNYRVFSHFELDDLALVNLIVGTNNSGKSSLLEAIYLLTSDDPTDSLFHILHERGEVVNDIAADKWRRNGYQLAPLFHGHVLQASKSIQIIGRCSKGETSSATGTSLEGKNVALGYEHNGHARLQESEISSTRAVVLKQTIGDSTPIQSRFPLQNGNLFLRPDRLPLREGQSRLVTTNYLLYDEFALLWDGITLTPKEDQVIEALQLVEPNIQRISFTSRQTSNSGVLLKLHKQATPVPLTSMGDGMRRILAITASLVSVEGGTLLVDEIDTGLYYEVLTDMWKLIFSIASKTKTQVFATTHSWDCVQAFQQALTEVKDRRIGQLVRLDRDGQHIQPVVYCASELDIAMRQRIEVR